MDSWIDRFKQAGEAKYQANHRILSFGQWMQELQQKPYSLTRTAPQYVLDMLEAMGWYEVSRPGQRGMRNRIFDIDFAGEVDPVFGQDQVQAALVSALEAFVAQGRADRILFLHGPNGSSKTSLMESMMRGLEEYSATPEGALYSFNWVFPRPEEKDRPLGFGAPEPGSGEEPPAESYAFLDSEDVAAQVISELRESPFFLIPREQRQEVLEEALKGCDEAERERFQLSPYLISGGLSHKSKVIFETLFNHNKGDVEKVLKHIQVQRIFISRRYRCGAVSVSPQMTADAGARQVTRDESLDLLPPVLRSQPLVETYGDLIDANNGVVEFSDMLKRSPEVNKYLLDAVERGEVKLPFTNAHLNLLFLATSNERHFQELKKSPDFSSIKGRLLNVAVPYILDHCDEERIYERLVKQINPHRHAAPGLTECAAEWAILTRLNPPTPDNYPEPLGGLVERLTPLGKASLYQGRDPGSDFYVEEKTLLRMSLGLIRSEYNNTPNYEGRYGVSPREMREVLEECFLDSRGACVGPWHLFERLDQLCKDRTMYVFLQLQSTNGFHQPWTFVDQVRQKHLSRLESGFLEGLGLVDVGQVKADFASYLDHLMALSEQGDLDGDLPEREARVEACQQVPNDLPGYRQGVVHYLQACRVDGPAHAYHRLLPDHYRRYLRHRMQGREGEVARAGALLPQFVAGKALPDKESAQRLERLVEVWQDQHGYCPECVLTTLSWFHENR